MRATFFVLGSHAERWPELVRRISHEGHQIGNHGYFHRKLQFKSPFYVSRDIRLGIRAIKRAGVAAPRYLPRTPRIPKPVDDSDRQLLRRAHSRMVARRLGQRSARRR